MRRGVFLCLAVLLAASGLRGDPAAPVIPLKVLYVGDQPTSARASQFTTFLQKRVARIEAVPRKGFDPAQAAAFDVVLLDWPQSGRFDEWKQAPIGARSTWTTPTVLLGSAGLNLAAAWQVRGGAG